MVLQLAACRHHTQWGVTFCQMSSKVSTPSVTFLIHLSISPTHNAIACKGPATVLRCLRAYAEVGRWEGYYTVSTDLATHPVASAYLPLPFVLVLLKSCIEKLSRDQVNKKSSQLLLILPLVHFAIEPDLARDSHVNGFGGKFQGSGK